MQKLCTMCRAQKPHAEFNRCAGRHDGLQTHCRGCSAACSRRYYQANIAKHRLVTRQRRREERQQFKRNTDDIKRWFGCRICGESDVVCLEFHHLDPAKKKFDISAAMAVRWSWATVLTEIRKCACLCANCHRKVHAGRFKVTAAMLCDV